MITGKELEEKLSTICVGTTYDSYGSEASKKITQLMLDICKELNKDERCVTVEQKQQKIEIYWRRIPIIGIDIKKEKASRNPVYSSWLGSNSYNWRVKSLTVIIFGEERSEDRGGPILSVEQAIEEADKIASQKFEELKTQLRCAKDILNLVKEKYSQFSTADFNQVIGYIRSQYNRIATTDIVTDHDLVKLALQVSCYTNLGLN